MSRKVKLSKRQEQTRSPQVGRPVNHPKIQVIETGEIYDSYEGAAKAINGNRGNILQCLRGLRQKCNGFTFRYVEGE